MKKVLLLIISLLMLTATAVFAYETVLIDFPTTEGWHVVYYETVGMESILQYVPSGQTNEDWTRTLIIHSYKRANNTGSASGLLDTLTSQMEAQNTSQAYRYLKYTPMDAIATRCIHQNKITPTQCDFFRTSKSFEGIMSMEYINKNTKEFKAEYSKWYNIVKDIKIYRSYYRTDRIMDKATSFEI